MNHAPEIEDEPVIAGRQRSDASNQRNSHISFPNITSRSTGKSSRAPERGPALAWAISGFKLRARRSYSRSMLYVRLLTGTCLLICLAGLRAAYAQPVPDRQAIPGLNRPALGPTLQGFHRVHAIGGDRYVAAHIPPGVI